MSARRPASRAKHWTRCRTCNLKTYVPNETCSKGHPVTHSQPVTELSPSMGFAELRMLLTQAAALMKLIGPRAEIGMGSDASPDMLDLLERFEGAERRRHVAECFGLRTIDAVDAKIDGVNVHAQRAWDSTPEEIGVDGVAKFLTGAR